MLTLGEFELSIMTYALFCVLYFKKASLSPKGVLFCFFYPLTSVNKCQTNIRRRIVWSGARIITCCRGIDTWFCLAIRRAFHLMQLILLVHDLTLLSGVKASLTFPPPQIRFPSWLPTKGPMRTIDMSQINFLVHIAWVCPVLTPSWRW